MNRTEILQTLHSVSSEVKQNYKAEIVGIFGSYARDEENPNSDIDVLVNFLEEKFGTKVDIVSKRALRKEIEPYVNSDLVTI